MKEREKLLGKAQRFLSSARLLTAAGDLDSAISRTYYAAFFVAEVLLDALGLSFSSHKGVLSAYGQHFARTSRLDPAFHRMLITAFEKRQQADYLAETGSDRREVEEMIQEAADFLRAARAWLERAEQGSASSQGGDRGPPA